MNNQTPDELLERAVAALVREWGIGETEALAAIERCRTQEQRLGEHLARAHTWDAA